MSFRLGLRVNGIISHSYKGTLGESNKIILAQNIIKKAFSPEEYKKYFPTFFNPVEQSGGWDERGNSDGWLTAPNPDDYSSALYVIMQKYLKKHYPRLDGKDNEDIAHMVSNAFWAGNSRGFNNAKGVFEKAFGETTVSWDSIEKAFKYIRKWMGKNGKWQYLYPEDLLRPIKAVKRLFGLEEKKLTTDYESLSIKKKYGADKKTFAGHILEYLSNRFKWDNIFKIKENRKKYDKPIKQKDIAAIAAEKMNGDGQSSLFKEKKPDPSTIINRSLMKKVWEIYNPLDAKADEADNQSIGAENGESKDRTGTGSEELPAGTPPVRDGGGESAGDLDVPSAKEADNKGEPGGPADESGGSPGRSVRERRGRAAIKDIREQVKKLLAEKKDDEFTEADKELLRQYEGGGGLAEKGATDHGTLYEFYTPQKVVNKVWSLVDKYNPRIDKTVIEPSAGTGRFAENRLEKFDLFELDETSARIAGILHPDANIKQGYFQELFMNGRTPKKVYTGKKYDVAIGNPPYGEYLGLHRGLGEGKIHTRIEEYFIDRSLDTLKDGGILAMVVPSSFLRGKHSKGKQAIAGKARLLEAWRLPNGTFGTTGVGTDIIVLRKEPGDPELFNNNAYFETHEDQIIGYEAEKMGRFGMEKYVSLPDGMGFDEALDTINPGKVPAIQIGELSPEVQAAAYVAVSEADEHKNRSEAMMGNDNAYKGGSREDIKNRIKALNSEIRELEKNRNEDIKLMQMNYKLDEDILAWQFREAAKSKLEKINELKREKAELEAEIKGDEHENRSQAMMGNDNAEGDRGGSKKKGGTDDYTPSIGKNMTADELNKKYGINVEKDDLPIWDATDYAGRIDITKLSEAARNYMKKSGNFTRDQYGNWYANVNYASGNIYEKLDELKAAYDGEKLTGYDSFETYNKNKALLEAALPTPKTAEQIRFSPISDFVKEYKIEDAENADLKDLRQAFEDWAGVNKWGYGRRASKHWNSDNSPISEYEIPPIISFQDVLAYMWQIPQKSDKATAKEFDSDTARIEAAKKREARRECAERLFNRFIREGLPEDKRKDLVEAWNRRFNSVVNPDYRKIPVLIEGMNTHKGDKEFTLTKEQVETISFMCNKGNGISAANVGVGKTVIGESVVVNRVQTGKAKRPLIVVPKAVYRKWIKEFHQHFPDMAINELYNFGEKSISRYKAGDGLNIQEGTISICTQDALPNITFKDETIEGDLITDMMDSQTIYDAEAQEKRTPKERAEEKESMMKKLGKGAKAKEGALFWEDCGFDCVMVDECFPYDTPVLTEKGWMKIGEIVERRENIKVYSCNYEQNLIELKPVIGWMPKRLDHIIVKVNLSNGESLTCTHNHEIWTENGYVRAEDISGQDVFMLRKNVQTMREGILLQILRGEIQPEKTVLFMPLRGGLPEQPAPYQGSGEGAISCNGGCDKGKENAVPFCQNEGKQSHEEPRNERKGKNEESREAICGRTWGEWEIYEAANSFNGIAQFAPGICNLNEGGNDTGCSQNLQGGSSNSREEYSNRDRRAFTHAKENTRSRHEEDSVFERVRVESVEVLERGSYKQYGFRSADDTTVYDITVEDNHNFIASGVLVKNCHNFKNVFGEARTFSNSKKDTEGKERLSNEFSGLKGSKPSDRAVKLFAITQLVQKQNNGQNVFGLSATPFTNSPIEVYNILSLVARNKLKELHIYNMHEFLAQFAEIKSEWSVGTKGEIVEKEVMKNWKNLGALQNLISEYMLYVDADEAGVIRPRKKPRAPQLELTPLQKAIIEVETDYMTNADPREDPGATLKAINYMRMATLSPASINRERWDFYLSAYKEKFKGMKVPKSEDFVTASPKMKFVCDSVTKAYKKLPNAGQIIYLPRGVNDFVHVKQYLMDQGMPEDSIAFMSSDTSMDDKERIKDDFNDVNGRIKVIIGSETIKEGVSLNGNTHSVYNCMLGWNPTETIQVEGRAWRQGNKQGHVHVVYPLMADSIDSLMYQKYDEKSSRINEIWSYKGDTSSDVSDINPEALKFDLIKDPAKKANFIVGQKRDKIRADRRIEEARYEVLFKDIRSLARAEEVLPEYKRYMDTAESEMLKKRAARDKAKNYLDEMEKKKADQDTIRMAKRALDSVKWDLEQATSTFRSERKSWKEYSDQAELYRAKFRKMGIRPGKEDDKLKEIAASIQKLKNEEASIDNSYAAELEKAKKELAAQRKKLPSISALVDENVDAIMGDLRPMDAVKKEIEAEIAAGKGIKKSLVIIGNRIYFKVS